MTTSPPRQRLPTSEERALWRTAMRDAVPFHHNGAVPAPPLPPVPAPPAASVPAGPAVAAARPAAAPVRPALPPLEPGGSAGIDRRTDQRLRRGKMAVEARIDLHGLTQSSAHGALCRFLDDSQRFGYRCVLVITGKGPVGQGGGVLRNAVPRWLAEPGIRRLIVALHHAQPRDGGDGALYVLLKRRRLEER